MDWFRGTIYRNTQHLMVKTMVSCKFSQQNQSNDNAQTIFQSLESGDGVRNPVTWQMMADGDMEKRPPNGDLSWRMILCIS